jgi:hypothetical protein
MASSEPVLPRQDDNDEHVRNGGDYAMGEFTFTYVEPPWLLSVVLEGDEVEFSAQELFDLLGRARRSVWPLVLAEAATRTANSNPSKTTSVQEHADVKES